MQTLTASTYTSTKSTCMLTCTTVNVCTLRSVPGSTMLLRKKKAQVM